MAHVWLGRVWVLASTVMAAAVYSSSARLLRHLEIDDPLEAAPVHLFGGALGVLAYVLLVAWLRPGPMPSHPSHTPRGAERGCFPSRTTCSRCPARLIPTSMDCCLGCVWRAACERWLGAPHNGCVQGGIKQFGQQALCVFAIIVWVGVNTFLVIKVLQHLHLLRVDVNTEMGGLDISKHGVTAYPEVPTYHVRASPHGQLLPGDVGATHVWC